jgi:hypothetical protein
MANEEEIRRVVKLIEAEPQRWQQACWFDPATANRVAVNDEWGFIYQGTCGTRACVAGHTVLMAGYQITTDSVVLDQDGQAIGMVDEVAAKILGLDGEQADLIFASATGFNSRHDCYEVAELKRVITEETGIQFDE